MENHSLCIPKNPQGTKCYIEDHKSNLYFTSVGKTTLDKFTAIACFSNKKTCGNKTALLSTLPPPNNNSFHQIETLLYSFIWSKKRDKIARKTIINTVKNGGLIMIDIRTFDKALKISWLKKICDQNFQDD